MTTVKIHGGIDILRLPVNEEEHLFPPWHLKYTQSHILHSKCSRSENACGDNDADSCQFCVFNRTLDLPHMPDMVFPNNILTLKYEDKAIIEFNALDALKRVSNGKINLQLACAEAWKESRSESSEYLEEKVKPFDWTFTTDYMGTMKGFDVVETSEKIDVNKLKQKEKILFYHDLTLFEDELHDNGIAVCSVKIRVMPSSFFVLLRYFLRVDNVMLKINDTRLFYEFGQDYLLREFTSREDKVANLRVSPVIFTEPNEIAQYLPITKSKCHKLTISEKSNVKPENLATQIESTSTLGTVSSTTTTSTTNSVSM
ncbi:TIP41-like protein [Neodiprion pinetum]|uniref:TIP41-like protein n=1 Tax=Neodiprion lecontei TaxID=441921 RepID=A0A6J0BR62_NEOLC|nr:TIP41-like protein [Neodiprion lecontei]XP_046488148.1 TIP41-like protein [Neodiprion pinetum]XP_046625297.1 TIP41-like protein [Neodiprion virginianus]